MSCLSTTSRCGEFIRVVSFFFSSRRRHTRLVSDWSSDVCSSDLSAHAVSVNFVDDHLHGLRIIRAVDPDRFIEVYFFLAELVVVNDHRQIEALVLGVRFAQREHQRSEERRVGKECRSWWTLYQCE